ncbi:hypothetical protein [Streptomyces ipomoeae]|uniref:hypothetical protein n=1 Tax=Streptomyces ipomoeae TaxID=103232 RepID=UPI0011464FD6|nr:hypothetical protein [Streptomyces ipomoeae]MDX2938844.1 hypothetical protein [Streptomyces ipomoeae]TQE21285.1 hypothetical protein SipoB123_26340 [Streptomyces ipomoeae]
MTTTPRPAIPTRGVRKTYGDDQQRVHVDRHDPARPTGRYGAAIGGTDQFGAVDTVLTGDENLLLMADPHHLGRRGQPAHRRAAEPVELTDAAGKLPPHYSGAMKRRVDLTMPLALTMPLVGGRSRGNRSRAASPSPRHLVPRTWRRPTSPSDTQN